MTIAGPALTRLTVSGGEELTALQNLERALAQPYQYAAWEEALS